MNSRGWFHSSAIFHLGKFQWLNYSFWLCVSHLSNEEDNNLYLIWLLINIIKPCKLMCMSHFSDARPKTKPPKHSGGGIYFNSVSLTSVHSRVCSVGSVRGQVGSIHGLVSSMGSVHGHSSRTKAETMWSKGVAEYYCPLHGGQQQREKDRAS